MSPDVAGALEVVAICLLLGGGSAIALWIRGHAEVERALCEWDADCADPNRVSVFDPQRMADAFGQDTEVTERLRARQVRSWAAATPNSASDPWCDDLGTQGGAA